jgi:tubulin polyglutamylase TTLL5
LDIKERPKTPPDNGYFYRVNADIKLIKHLLEDNGFLETYNNFDFSLYWHVGPIKNEIYQSLNFYQRVNHFPKSHEITRKDSMHRNISRMQLQYGLKNFDFIPKSFILPAETSLLINV